MFRSAANPLLRVAMFPVLLLFWQYVFGTDLPLLAPAMCVVFCAISDDLVRFASVMFAVLLGIMSLISLLPKQRSAGAGVFYAL